MDGLPKYQWTEEKLFNLKPIFEEILSKKHGREIKILNMKVDGVSFNCRNDIISKKAANN